MTHRMDAYITKRDDGNVEIDAEGLAVDLITVLKGSGCSKEQFIKLVSTTWDEIEVTVNMSGAKTN